MLFVDWDLWTELAALEALRAGVLANVWEAPGAACGGVSKRAWLDRDEDRDSWDPERPESRFNPE